MTEKLMLVKPSVEYIDEIRAYLQELALARASVLSVNPRPM